MTLGTSSHPNCHLNFVYRLMCWSARFLCLRGPEVYIFERPPLTVADWTDANQPVHYKVRSWSTR